MGVGCISAGHEIFLYAQVTPRSGLNQSLLPKSTADGAAELNIA